MIDGGTVFSGGLGWCKLAPGSQMRGAALWLPGIFFVESSYF